MVIFLALAVLISGGNATGLGHTARPRAIGWPLLVIATTAAVFTVDRCANGLAVLFGTAALNGLIRVVSGHAINQPSVSVPRLEGFFFLLLGIGASVTTSCASERGGALGVLARAACIGLLACAVAVMTGTMSSIEHWETPILVAFVLCLAALWAGTKPSGTSKQQTG